MNKTQGPTAVVAVLGAVGVMAAQTSAVAQRGTLKIAMIAKSEANFVFLAARRGAEDKTAALSRQRGAAITISWLTPARADAAEQAEGIRQA